MSTELFAGRYRIIRQIGTGGMGVVFEAEDQLLQKTFAVKTIHKGFLQAEQVIRFQREAKALASLNHPNLVPVYVFGLTDDNEPYMVMRLESGVTLAELIEGRGRLPIFKSVHIFLQICDAMQHAHEHGVLHRDLKPSNIMVRDPKVDTPSIVILDFGVALVDSDNAFDALTKTGVIVGTPAYMSPEQVKGQQIDARSDVYSLGCIMFAALTGVVPFSANSSLEVLSMKTTSTAPSINREGSDAQFPQGIEEIVAKALATGVGSRYQSMAELKADLLNFKTGGYTASIKVSENEPTVQKPAEPSETFAKSGIVALVAGLSVVVIGLCAVLWKFFDNESLDDKQPPQKMLPQVQIAPDLSMKNVSYNRENGKLEVDEPQDEDYVMQTLNRYPIVYELIVKDGPNISFEKLDQISKKKIRKNLVAVCATACGVTMRGLQAIRNLPNLRNLAIRKGDVPEGGLAQFASLPTFESLDLTESEVTAGDLADIYKMTRLKWLVLSLVQNITDDEVKSIATHLKELKLLGLQGTEVTPGGLSSLRKLGKLEFLNLVGLNLKNDDFKIVATLDSVVNLEINGNPATIEGVMHLTKMKRLKLLRVDHKMVVNEAEARKLQKALGPGKKVEIK